MAAPVDAHDQFQRHSDPYAFLVLATLMSSACVAAKSSSLATSLGPKMNRAATSRESRTSITAGTISRLVRSGSWSSGPSTSFAFPERLSQEEVDEQFDYLQAALSDADRHGTVCPALSSPLLFFCVRASIGRMQ